MAWQRLSPEGAAELAPWKTDDEEVPLFQRVMKTTFRYKQMKQRAVLLTFLLIGFSIGHFLPRPIWLGAVGFGVVLVIILGIESFRNYLRAERIQLEAMHAQGIREVERKPKAAVQEQVT